MLVAEAQFGKESQPVGCSVWIDAVGVFSFTCHEKNNEFMKTRNSWGNPKLYESGKFCFEFAFTSLKMTV